MRVPTLLAASCLASILFAACSGGDDGASGATDGGNHGSGSNQQDSFIAPEANCAPLDLASAPAIPIVNQQVTPNPQGGTVHADTYVLQSVKLYASGLPVSGTAKARVEIVTGTATSGAARVAVALNAMALGQTIDQQVTGAGLYTITTPNLVVADGCGGTDPLPTLKYTATAAALTLWTEYMVTDPIPLTIPLELGFKVE